MSGMLGEHVGLAHPPLAEHLLHLGGALLFFVLALLGVAATERAQAARRASPRTGPWPLLLPVTAAAGFGAGLVHYAVTPAHLTEATVYGAFFALAGTVQLGYSMLLTGRPSRSFLALGALGNAALVALWWVSRTSGVPLGPDAGTVERFGRADVLASSLELLALGGLLLALLRTRRSRPAGRRALPAEPALPPVGNGQRRVPQPRLTGTVRSSAGRSLSTTADTSTESSRTAPP